jgi:simple sugar transport system substrate-binding protein
MSENDDVVGDLNERLDWHDAKGEQTPHSKARAVTRRAALSGGAAALGAYMLSDPIQALASAHTASAASAFGTQKAYHFVVVNHATTNAFFTPTIYGIQDACNLLGCTYTWTGSPTSNIPAMVSAINSAITSGADGIATSLIDPVAFNVPVANAIKKGIPVISYNADEPNARLAYVGQDLLVSGQEMGAMIKSLVKSGDVAIFIATPGTANIQPRATGALDALKGSAVKATQIASGVLQTTELTNIEAFWPGHTSYKGLFAVDGGSTTSVGQTIQKYKLKGKVIGGGYDLSSLTPQLLQEGFLNFTIFQNPYLQGFFPIVEMFLYQASKGLTGPADIDTGLKFINPSTVGPYNSSKSRFMGTATTPGSS